MKVIEQLITIINIISIYLHSFEFNFLHLNNPHTVSDSILKFIVVETVGFVDFVSLNFVCCFLVWALHRTERNGSRGRVASRHGGFSRGAVGLPNSDGKYT